LIEVPHQVVHEFIHFFRRRHCVARIYWSWSSPCFSPWRGRSEYAIFRRHFLPGQRRVRGGRLFGLLIYHRTRKRFGKPAVGCHRLLLVLIPH
jgi:hypothetical protein